MVIVPSPFREGKQRQWNIPASIGSGELPVSSKPVSETGGPISPVKPLPRASSRLKRVSLKRKAGQGS